MENLCDDDDNDNTNVSLGQLYDTPRWYKVEMTEPTVYNHIEVYVERVIFLNLED